MLDKKEIENPRAIEENVCLKIKSLRTFPMSENDTEILCMLLMSNNRNPVIPQEQKPFLYQLIEKRLEVVLKFKINDSRLILFLMQVTETPGKAVMMLWYLQWWCHTKNMTELDLDTFCRDIFPMGFPSDEDLSKVWNEQKIIGAGNLVDYTSAGQSILS